MDMSSWNGSLSWSEFCYAAAAFADKWKTINQTLPSCSWTPCHKQPWSASSQPPEGYLSLEGICVLRSSEVDSDEGSGAGKEEIGCSDNGEPVDDAATLVQTDCYEAHYYDFHVVYSTSYRVPVLYFRGYCSDGQPLVLDEIEKDLPACSAKVLLESKWTFITLEEHPYLHRPWYKLHPCGTSEWMKLLFAGDASQAKNGVVMKLYLVSWLSVVGQVVGLKIPFEMMNDDMICCS